MKKILFSVNSLWPLLLVLLIIPALLIAQPVVINEFLASNGSILVDEDGDYTDWIELYNPTARQVRLENYTLTDDPDNPAKWTFPAVNIEAYGFLLIFASGKDRKNLANHWETIITRGDNWKYRLGHSEPPSGWRTLEFDDAAWQQGPGGFGYGDDDDATVISPTLSLYTRKKFNIDDVAEITHLLLHVDYDDAFVAFLNDTEIARANIGVPGDHPAYNRLATNDHEALIYQGGLPELFIVENIQAILQPGENVLAVQVHNCSQSSSDMTIISFLTLGLKHPPSGTPNGVPVLLQSSLPYTRLHTNFKLTRDGEFIGIYAANAAVSDSLTFGEQLRDISFGRQPDAGNDWYYFPKPTPAARNDSAGVAGFAETPTFSQDAGFYSFYKGTLDISLSTASPGTPIYYTRDGSEPTESSARYSAPIRLNKTTVLRAGTFGKNLLPSPIITATYLINKSFSLPVISLVTDPPNLWDDSTGIYVLGNDYSPNYPHFGANFWQDWERPVHVEYFEADGTPGFSLDAGVKIHGAWMRALPQKSLRIYARGGYGTNAINYKIFDDKPIDKFKVIMLRNSGNDWDRTLFRDAFMQRLIKDTDLDRMAYKPAIVFLNGEFWGIHNIRERYDKHYLQSNRGIDPENVDILEYNRNVVEGDAVHYNSMINYIETHAMRIDADFEHVQTLMDTDNFMDYNIFQIYYANTDWPGNNIKYWRPKTPDGRWKWLMFDTDFGFGYQTLVNHNTLAFATQTDGPGWPNPPWSTFLLRKLLENEGFRIDFINRFADLMNSTFTAESVINTIDRMKAVLDADMPEHKKKWGGSISDWEYRINRMKYFAKNRSGYMRGFIQGKFGLTGQAVVSMDVSPEGAGKIRINTVTVDSFPWSGKYFKAIPIELTAIPEPGYVFSQWSDIALPDTSSIKITLTSGFNVTAIFKIDALASVDSLFINEFMADNDSVFRDQAGEYDDWIELYNAGSKSVNLGGMYLTDDLNNPTKWQIPDTAIAPSGFLLFWADEDQEQGPLHTNFKLSRSGEQIGLFDTEAMGNPVIDTLSYSSQTTDVSYGRLPDGGAEWRTFDTPTPGKSNRESPVRIADNGTEQKIPTRFALSQNFPNPFNPETNIGYDLPKAGCVRLHIYDIRGRRVKTLSDGNQAAGSYNVSWDGTAENNKPVASGVYVYRLIAGDAVKLRKMLLLR